jgi:predicted Zn-dependent protease
LATAQLIEVPTALRGAAWKAASLVQQPFPRHISGTDDLHNALQEFVQVLDDDPWAAEATVLTSECLVRLEERRPAVMALTALVNRQPDNVDAHRWLAAIYIDLNSPGPAVKHLQEWARLDPANARPYRWLGFFTRDGLFTGDAANPVDSVEAYRKSLQLGLEERERSAVLRELAELQMNTHGDFAAALETLHLGSQAFQDQPSISAQRAHCLVQLGKRDEAIGILDELVHAYPATKAALLLRARISIQEDQPQAAIPLLEKLIALDPDHFLGRQNLMLAYGAIKDDKRAAEQKRYLENQAANAERLLKIRQQTAADPWNALARHRLALEYSAVDRSEALAWIHAAFASYPDDQTIRKTWTQMIGYQPPTPMRPSPSSSTESR